MLFNSRMISLFAIAFLAADNGGGTGGTVEAVTPETETPETETNERAEAVEDAVIIKAYLEAASMKDADGKVIGTMQDAADLAGMKRGSFNGRIGSLKKLLGADKFPKLAQAVKTGKTRKKNVDDVLALFNQINGELGKPADTTVETTPEATESEAAAS